MTQRKCFFDGCIEPVTKSHAVMVDRVSHDLDLCADHFHDIDWEVIAPDELSTLVRASNGSDLGSHDAA